MVFPGGSVLKNLTVMQETCRRLRFDPWMGRSSGEGNGNPPVFLPGKPHGQRNLAGYIVHGVTKN